MPIVLAGASSGQTTIQATDATTQTITLPANSGTVLTSLSTQSQFPANIAGNGPAFSAYQSTLQSLTGSAYTKVQFQTKEYDTNSNFDNATNYRFTATISGYYQINSTITGAGVSAVLLSAIYKNGSAYKYGTLATTGVSNSPLSGVSSLVYLNVNDYIEIYAFSGATQNTQVGIAFNWFNGSLVRSA